MGIKFLYRQMFALFFLISFSIIIILGSFQGRNALEETVKVLLISFGFGIFGIIINFLLNLIFSSRSEVY